MKYNVNNIFYIVKNEIYDNNYVESLLYKTLKYQIISKEEYEEILFKFISILFISIKKYTGELSSSVKIGIAKNICITVDYDAFLERPKLYGIEFINKYLDYINYENIFCKKFNEEIIVNLLKKV